MANRLENEFQLSSDEILSIIHRSPRCKQMVKGFVAEYHLEKVFQDLVSSGEIKSFRRIDADSQPDFTVDGPKRSYRVECKLAMSAKRYKNGDIKIDFQRTRNSASNPKSRFYKKSDFDIVATCLYNQTGKWEFKFISTSDIPIDEKYNDCLKKALRYPGGLPWADSIIPLLH